MNLVLPWKRETAEPACLMGKCVNTLALNTVFIVCFLKDLGTLSTFHSFHFPISNQELMAYIYGKD